MKPITIIAICAICAATLMSGCLGGDDPVSVTHQPPAEDIFDEMGDNFVESDRIKVLAQEILMAPPHPPSIISEPMVAGAKSSIPDDYYNISVDQYFIDHKLHNYLDGYTWNRPLIRGAGWGLPEAAELEHELAEIGCNVSIRLAHVRTTVNHDGFEGRVETDGYARSGRLPELDQCWSWLMIELDGEMVAYEVCGSYWVFKPDSAMKDEYVSDGRWHDWWNYKENMTYIYNGNTWTMHDFRDFNDIYELEEYYLSGAAQADRISQCTNGEWCSYYTSDGYNATDDFMIGFGWWMSEDEYHETETRVNEATDWFVLVD